MSEKKYELIGFHRPINSHDENNNLNVDVEEQKQWSLILSWL